MCRYVVKEEKFFEGKTSYFTYLTMLKANRGGDNSSSQGPAGETTPRLDERGRGDFQGSTGDTTSS